MNSFCASWKKILSVTSLAFFFTSFLFLPTSDGRFDIGNAVGDIGNAVGNVGNAIGDVVKDMVEEVDIRTVDTSDGNKLIRASIIFNLQEGSQLPEGIVTIPISHPHPPHLPLGNIQILGSEGAINLDFNLSNASGLEFGDGTLPDGSQIPMAGLAGADIFQILIDEGRHSIYLGLNSSKGVFMFGFAVTIDELSGISNAIGGTDLFYNVTILDSVRVTGGVFGDKGGEEGNSGAVFFFDIGGLITPERVHELLMEDKSSLTIRTDATAEGEEE